MADRPVRVLLVYPEFVPNSFWNYTDACKLVGAKYPAAPLGLITVAAMLPASWECKLVNRNTETLDSADLDWADMVMTGGMLNQQPDCQRIIKLAQKHGKPAVVGGPDATSSPHVYATADFQVLGEAEDVIKEFIAAWEHGDRSGIFTTEKFKVDVSKTPMPRFDLLNMKDYLYVCVQYSRGCPFTCEFCDIIELYGRVPRAKTNVQMLAELEKLYELGYRGHVDFVDDNLIGNKKALRLFLPELKAWQEAHDYPFEFSTEASLNLADDDELLEMLKQCNFFAIFVGIESPDPETLIQMRKKQNTKRNIPECIQKIYSYGIFVTAGFIVGFDNEKGSIADSMAELINECAIPISIVGLLYALPNTQLTRRLEKEGRLNNGHDVVSDDYEGDQCANGINFVTKRPLRDVLADYKRVLEQIYDPVVYAARLERLSSMLNRKGRINKSHEGDSQNSLAWLETVNRVINAVPETRDIFWKTFVNCARTNPDAVRYIMRMIAVYMHLGPFARQVIAQIDRRIAEIDEMQPSVPAAVLADFPAMQAS
jgi:radical SAM superfamily enzyme YgiQ (UPF0313 family)